MNNADWASATGSPLVGCGRPYGRPTQAYRQATAAKRPAGRLQREIALLVASAKAPIEASPRARTRTMITPSYAYWRASPAEQLQTLSVLQRFHRPR